MVTTRTQVRRRRERAAGDDVVHDVLAEGLVAHVGIATADGPVVIPMTYGVVADTLYLHGSPASRLLRSLAEGVEVCATVTILDGLVLARSAFHHTMNYRSAVVFGRARLVDDPDEKARAFRAIVDHIVPGRWNDVRLPTDKEVETTSVLALALDETSAKVRTGPPVDEEDDYSFPVWAGVVPLALRAGSPVPDPRLPNGIEAPNHAVEYRRPERS